MSEITRNYEKSLPIELGIEHQRAVELSKELLVQYFETKDYCETFKAIMVNTEFTQAEKYFLAYMTGCYNADSDSNLAQTYVMIKASRNESIPNHIADHV